MPGVRSLCLIFALAAGCRPAAPPELTVQERAAVADGVRSILDSLATWMNSQGAGRTFASFYDSAPGFVQVSDGRVVMSGVAVRRPGGWKIAAVHTSIAPEPAAAR